MYFIGRKTIAEQLSGIQDILEFESLDDFEVYANNNDISGGYVVIDTYNDNEYMDTLYFILQSRNSFDFKFIILVDNLEDENISKFYEFGIYAITSYDDININKIKQFIDKYPASLEDVKGETPSALEDIFGDIFSSLTAEPEQQPQPQGNEADLILEPIQDEDDLEEEIDTPVRNQVKQQSEVQQPVRQQVTQQPIPQTIQQPISQPIQQPIPQPMQQPITQQRHIQPKQQSNSSQQKDRPSIINPFKGIMSKSRTEHSEKQNRLLGRNNIAYNEGQIVKQSTRKVIGFTGFSDVGVTTVILLLAEILSKQNSVAILDLTSNRDLYEIYPFTRDSISLMESKKSLYELAEFNVKKPFKISKHVDLYTAPYTLEINMPPFYELVARIEQDYDIILVDMDLDIDRQLLSYIQDLYIISDVEPTNIKYTSEYMYKISQFLNMSKVRIILNKYITNNLTDEMFIRALTSIVSFEPYRVYHIIDFLPPYFKIDFTEDIIKASIDNMLELRELPKQVQKQIQLIANSI